ncbi:MAG TPA: phosphoribosylanthranilate isomerase [Bryobacteraceae bacterium]|nr:phosphoribosylanthranilate isomerase [Bryobacteraceae bacterium]
MIVKICGITNWDDAEAAVEAGATALGFNFYRESPRYLSPTGAALIGEKLIGENPNVTRVGVFVNESAANVAKIVLEANLDVAQLHGSSQGLGVRIWRAAHPEDVPGDELAEAILLDTPSNKMYGGTGESFDWSVARGLPYKVILAGGLHAGNVGIAIKRAKPWGVDSCSRLESSPGVKDHEKMRQFVQAALAAAATLNL